MSASPVGAMTTGFGPGGVSGIWRRAVIHCPSISTSRTSSGGSTGNGGRGGSRTQAASATRRTSGAIVPRAGHATPPSTARATAGILLAVALATGCAPRPLLARAIHARGGPLRSLVRQVESQVYTGFPGTWRWQATFLVPDRYAWTIFTTREADHYLFDGETVRAFVGRAEVSADTDAAAPLRTHARFTAVVNLDVLLQPGVQVVPAAADRLPAGAVAGLDVGFPDDGSRYLLAFDAHDLLVHAEGPLALPPLGRGRVTATFSDFRRTGRWVLPWATDYVFDGEPLASERTLATCPDDPRLTPESFLSPDALPDCAQRPIMGQP